MAEYTPPTDNVPIFDVSNFISSSSGGGLTEALIATKFLRFPTGQGTETLPTLITGNITAPDTMNIVMPNTSASNVLNVGVVTRNIAGQIHHYSDGDNCVAGAGVHINNGLNNKSTTNIANGNGTTLSDATGAVNIKSGNNNTGTITIGKFTSATNKTTTTINGDSNISTTGGIVSIATGSARNTSIGIGTGDNIGINGSININTGALCQGQTSINSGFNATGAILIGNSEANTTQQCNIQSGQISIGAVAPSTNTRNITIGATDSGFNSNTSLNGNTTVLGTTNINTSGTANTSIGVVGSNTTIAGTTNINTTGSTTTTIGVQGSTINMRGGVNINTNGTGGHSNTSIGLAGSVTSIQGTTNVNTNGGATTIGASSGGTTSISSPTINIGNADTITTMNGTNIKQNIKLTGGFIIENVVGNTTSASSMSTTFNRKSTGSLSTQACYTIASGATDQFTAQYFELIVSGANNNRGSYTFKCFFGIDKRGSSNPVPSSVNTLFYQGTNGVAPTVSFTATQTTVTLSVNTSAGSSSSDQNFITTLFTYPTITVRGSISPTPLEDFIITAI